MNISIDDFKVGDNVYPLYDGKVMRGTRCIITDINEEVIEVEGIFWGHDVSTKGYFNLQVDEDDGESDICGYIGDKDSLMVLLGVAEEGDYYSLRTETYMKRTIELYRDIQGGVLKPYQIEYFQSLGLIEEV